MKTALPSSKFFRQVQVIFLLMLSDSDCAKPAYITRYSSLSLVRVSMRCSSKNTPIPLAFSIRTVSRQSTVFRANRDTDFVMIQSIFPARQSLIMRLNPGRLSALVPEMPSSAYRSANFHSFFALIISVQNLHRSSADQQNWKKLGNRLRLSSSGGLAL